MFVALSVEASSLKIHKQILLFCLEGASWAFYYRLTLHLLAIARLITCFLELTFTTYLLAVYSCEQFIREEILAWKTDKEIYEKLEDDFGETVFLCPRFDLQTAGLWLSHVKSCTIIYSSRRFAVNVIKALDCWLKLYLNGCSQV